MLSTDTDLQDDSGLNWVRTGPRNGATVILIHPVGHDLTYWADQIDALQPHYDVIALDLPGHGRSPVAAEPLSFVGISDRLARLVASLGKGAVHVVGISVGGMIAQSFALAYPDKVRSLSLIATAATFADVVRDGMRARAETVEQGGMAAVLHSSLERWFTPETRARRPDLIERISRTMLANNPEVHAAMWRMIATFEVLPRLAEIVCPTLVLVGDKDPSTPPSAAALIAENIAGAQLVVLTNTSHIAMLESPAAVNAELLRFLAENG